MYCNISRYEIDDDLEIPEAVTSMLCILAHEDIRKLTRKDVIFFRERYRKEKLGADGRNYIQITAFGLLHNHLCEYESREHHVNLLER